MLKFDLVEIEGYTRRKVKVGMNGVGLKGVGVGVVVVVAEEKTARMLRWRQIDQSIRRWGRNGETSICYTRMKT